MDGHGGLLILAAHELELQPLRGALDAARQRSPKLAMAEVGVGLTLAGAGAMRCLLQQTPRAVLVLGSYGRYPDETTLTPGRLLIPTRLLAVDAGVLAGRAAYPAPMAVSAEPDAALSHALALSGPDMERGTIAATLAITEDDALARELRARSGCVGENLEALAIGLACQTLGIAWSALLGCTNQVGAQGRAQWRAHHALAAATTADHVRAWLDTGAPGLPSA